MIEHASWLIQPIRCDRSKRLFGLLASLVRGEKIAQFGDKKPFPTIRESGDKKKPWRSSLSPKLWIKLEMFLLSYLLGSISIFSFE
jgi:hypothetical protein